MADYIVRGFSLEEGVDLAIIKRQAQRMGGASDSAALRFILRTWEGANQTASTGSDGTVVVHDGGVQPAVG